MAKKSKADRLKEEARKAEELAARKQRENARKFSKDIDSMSDSINDLQKSIKSTLKEVDKITDVKSKTKLLEKLNKEMSQLEAQTESLQSGFDTFGKSLSDTENEIADMTVSASRDMLRSLRDVIEEENKKAEEEAKSAEEALKEARENARKTSEIYTLSQEAVRKKLVESLNKEKEIREDLEADTRKLLTASTSWERKYLQDAISKRQSQLSQLYGTIDSSMEYLDEIPEEIKENVDEIHHSAEILSKTLNQIVEDVDESLNDGLSHKIKEFCDEVRDAMMSLEVDAILQSMQDQVDNFIETQRQILSRTGATFDESKFSDTISKSMKDVGYTYSRNEMASTYKDFINATRVQNLEVMEKYMADMASINKAYGVSIDSMTKLFWQDMNSGQNGQMVRQMSNIAAELEDNGNLYTSAESILSALNDKAELIYGIARGDSARQKEMLKSVATIQAIQETAANAGVSDFSEAVMKIGSLGTAYDAREDETTLEMARALNMSTDEVYKLAQSNPAALYQAFYDKFKNMNDADVYTYMKSYQGIFGNSANMKAFLAQSEKDLAVLKEAKNTANKGASIQESLAAGKALELSSLVDTFTNALTDNSAVKYMSDLFGKLDIPLANAAHAVVVASNLGSFISNFGKHWGKLYKGLGNMWSFTRAFPGLLKTNFLKGFGLVQNFFTKGFGGKVLTNMGNLATTYAPTLTSALGRLGTAFSTGLSTLGTYFSKGIATIGPQVAKFALNPLTLSLAGVALTIKDAIGGYEKRKEWLGERGDTLSGTIASTLGGALGGTGPGFGEGPLLDVVGNVASNVAKDAAVGAAIGSIIPGVGTAVGGLIGATTGAITGIIGGKRITNALIGTFDTVVDGLDYTVENISEFSQYLGPAGRAFGNIVEGQWDLIKETGNEISEIWGDPNHGVFNKVIRSIETLVKVPFKQVSVVITGIKKGFTSFFTDLTNTFTDISSKISDMFSFNLFSGKKSSAEAAEIIEEGYAEGLSEVPNDGIAYLHKGEAVLTKEQAITARADGGIDVNNGNAWNPGYSDLYLAESLRDAIIKSGGVGSFNSAEDVYTAVGNMSTSDKEQFLRNIREISESMSVLEDNSVSMNSGFRKYFREEDENSEERSKFQKALKKFLGIETTDGMAGTSGAGGRGILSRLRNVLGGGGSSGGSGGSGTGTPQYSGGMPYTITGNDGYYATAYSELKNSYPEYAKIVDEMSAKHGVDKNLLAAMMKAESGFNANAVSDAGAKGLMQVMPNTFAGFGVGNDIFDPRQNIEAGTMFIKNLLNKFNGDAGLAVAAYNAGPGAAEEWLEEYGKNWAEIRKVILARGSGAPGTWAGETVPYVDKILGTSFGNLDGFKSQFIDKTESAPGATDLSRVQIPVKQAMNLMAEEHFKLTGRKLDITGAAELGYHAPGEYGHEGGWKIDLSKTADREVLINLARKYGVSVGDEGDHYDLAFNGDNVGGEVLYAHEGGMNYNLLQSGEAVTQLTETSKDLSNQVMNMGELMGKVVPSYDFVRGNTLENGINTVVTAVKSNQDGVVDAIVSAVGTLSSKLDAVVSAIGEINIRVNTQTSNEGPKDVVNSNTGFIYSL